MIKISDKEQSGERKGLSAQQKHTLSILGFIFAILPIHAFASTPYLMNNADDFVTYTRDAYGEMIDIAALLHDYDPKMITAVIVVESEGKNLALSNKGARGLMQLMPGTAKAMGASDPKDPFQNILAGTKYLKELEERYGFANTGEALVAYNMGPSRAKRWLSQYDPAEYGYVKKVMYVYDVLTQQELESNKIASNPTKDLRPSIFAQGVPLFTRPRSLSLLTQPFSDSAIRTDLIAKADTNNTP